MSKKRNRQPDANCESCRGSNVSCDESTIPGTKCPHITKAVNFAKIKKCLTKVGISKECSVCKKCIEEPANVNDEEQKSIIDKATLVCLQCGHQGCGKEEGGHALEHFKKQHSDCHYMVVEMLSWSVWCFQCEIKIEEGYSHKLDEMVRFIKKRCNTAVIPLQGKIALPQLEKDVKDIANNEKVPLNFPKVVGLTNLGNTCFFNAVLQCLAQTPFLVKVLHDLSLPGQKIVLPGGKHKMPNSSEEIELPPIEGVLEGWGSFTSILYKTLSEMQNSDGHQTYCPSELLNSFKKKTMHCMDGGQHDAHELLRHLLEIVRNEDLRRYQSIILKEVGLNEKTKPEDVEESLKARVKFYGNQASARLLGPEPVFRGVLVSTLECLDCHHTSQSTELFLDLSLPVMAEKPQPPILKRKSNGFEDTFDITGNSISHMPSKHQLKKEKKAARKNRKNKRQGNRNDGDGFGNKGNVSEGKIDVLESDESDADVEDNMEGEGLPEIGELNHNSEKQSSSPSTVAPSTGPKEANEALSEEPLNNHLGFNENHIPLVQVGNSYGTNSSHSLKNTSTINHKKSEHQDGTDSFEVVDMENGYQSGMSLSTSLAITSDLTRPEMLTVSLNSAASEERPTSPACNLTNGGNVDKMSMIESINHNDEEGNWEQRKARKKEETPVSNKVTNGIASITSGISKVGIVGSLQQSPTRYSTKEGECSIQSCLNQFTSLELMSGSNRVGCEACTARETKVKESGKMVCTSSTKQYLISRVPAVLILHLKRFQAQRIYFRKVIKPVWFPALLDLAPICKKHKKPRLYALYGMVQHSGTIHGGHYVAYVKARSSLKPDDSRLSFLPPKNDKDTQEDSYSSSSDSETEEASATLPSTMEPPPGKWYLVSDSRVTEVDEATVLRSQAYLLFYERIV